MELIDTVTKLAQLRISKNISQRELSLRLEKDTTYINKVETGRFNVGIQSLLDICKILEIDIIDLFKK